jgi:hypothetical protein
LLGVLGVAISIDMSKTLNSTLGQMDARARGVRFDTVLSPIRDPGALAYVEIVDSPKLCPAVRSNRIVGSIYVLAMIGELGTPASRGCHKIAPSHLEILVSA